MPKSAAILVFIILLVGIPGVQAFSDLGSACDRACLEGFVNQYLEALLAHDPFGLPWAAQVRFSENDQLLAVGEGLWATVSGPGTYKLYFADPQSGQVGFFGTLRENGTPVALALRLKIQDRRISEAESLVLRESNFGGAKNIEEIARPDALFLEAVPKTERLSREALIKATNQYFEGIVQGRGEIVPFDKDCNRVENGIQTTNNPGLTTGKSGASWNPMSIGCSDQLNTKIFNYIQKIYPRRFLVVDEERQTVFGFFMFQHPGDILSVESPGHGTYKMPDNAISPFFVDVAELFKLKGGKIRKIEALMVRLPYGTPSPFFAGK